MKNHLMMWLHVSDDLFVIFQLITRDISMTSKYSSMFSYAVLMSPEFRVYTYTYPAAGISKFAKHVINILHFTQGANKWTVLHRRICLLSDHKVHIYYWIDFDRLMPAAWEQRESMHASNHAKDWRSLIESSWLRTPMRYWVDLLTVPSSPLWNRVFLILFKNTRIFSFFS